MKITTKKILGGLAVLGLLLVAAGTRIVSNWDAVSRGVIETLDTQTARTEATLFRLGELMSIGAELKARYGIEPDLTYETETGERVLGIVFDDYRIPENALPADHAREIASFAIGHTAKSEQVDSVRVRFAIADDARVHVFSPDDLLPS